MATQNKVIVAVGYMLRFNAAFDKLRELLKQVGPLGPDLCRREQHQCMCEQCKSCKRLLACLNLRSSSSLMLPPGSCCSSPLRADRGLPVPAALQNPDQQHHS